MKRRILTFAMATMLLCMVPCVGVSAGENDGYVPVHADGNGVEQYADDYPNGDANSDKDVDIEDLIAIKKCATGHPANNRITWRGDMFRNGRIDDVWDMHLIRRTLLERENLQDKRSGIVLDPDGDANGTHDLTECLEIVDIYRDGWNIKLEIKNTSHDFEPESDATITMEKTAYNGDPKENEEKGATRTEEVGVLMQGESVTLEWKVVKNITTPTTVNILRATEPIWTVPVM
ncbi:MAG: hypothetical protein UHS49_06985 [Faecalimonas sp.]|nr:hypothetical protein [Faecalimonas sp.]